MDPNLRNIFREKFMEQAEDNKLSSIGTTTFVRQLDNKTQASSNDVVYALSTILESPKNLSRRDNQLYQLAAEEIKRQQEEAQAQSRIGTIVSDSDRSLEHANECKYANFWVAYDALEQSNKGLVDMGIEMAKDL